MAIDKTDYAAGQMIAITAMLRCLIKSHPDKAALLAMYEDSFNAAMAVTVPADVSNDYLLGLQEQRERLWLGISDQL